MIKDDVLLNSSVVPGPSGSHTIVITIGGFSKQHGALQAARIAEEAIIESLIEKMDGKDNGTVQ